MKRDWGIDLTLMLALASQVACRDSKTARTGARRKQLRLDCGHISENSLLPHFLNVEHY